MRELKTTDGIVMVYIFPSKIKIYLFDNNYMQASKIWKFQADEMHDYTYMENIEDIFDTIQSDITLTGEEVLELQKILNTWVDYNSAKGENDND